MYYFTYLNLNVKGVWPPQERERQEDAGGKHAFDPDVRRYAISGNSLGRDAASRSKKSRRRRCQVISLLTFKFKHLANWWTHQDIIAD